MLDWKLMFSLFWDHIKYLNEISGLKTLLLLLITTKSQFIGKDPDVRKNWGQEEKGAIEGEMVGWHYQLNEYESESCSVMSNSLWPHGL